MNSEEVIQAMAALAHSTRLSIFRLLLSRFPDGMSAGDVAAALSVAPPTMSFHLAQLYRARLVYHRRQSRSIIYYANEAGLQAVMDYLATDCCQSSGKNAAPRSEHSALSPNMLATVA